MISKCLTPEIILDCGETMNRLTRSQWEKLEQQMGITPLDSDPDGVRGEHMKLIALLNRFGFNPMFKQEAQLLERKLLEAGWREDLVG